MPHPIPLPQTADRLRLWLWAVAGIGVTKPQGLVHKGQIYYRCYKHLNHYKRFPSEKHRLMGCISSINENRQNLSYILVLQYTPQEKLTGA